MYKSVNPTDSTDSSGKGSNNPTGITEMLQLNLLKGVKLVAFEKRNIQVLKIFVCLENATWKD
jgi:hypothetical protein